MSPTADSIAATSNNNMNKLIPILLLVAATASAQIGITGNAAFVGAAGFSAAGGGGSGALLDDSLDYDDVSAAILGGWINSASAPDWHYITSPAPLGSYGYTSSFSDPTGIRYATRTFTASDEVWVYFMFYNPTGGGNYYWINLLDSNTNIMARIRSVGDVSIRAMNGTAYTGASWTNTTSTKYVCFRFRKSTGGNNGVASVYISDTTTLPGSPTDTTSSGTSTGQVSQVSLGLDSDNLRTIYQRLKIFTTDQGTAFP